MDSYALTREKEMETQRPAIVRESLIVSYCIFCFPEVIFCPFNQEFVFKRLTSSPSLLASRGIILFKNHQMAELASPECRYMSIEREFLEFQIVFGVLCTVRTWVFPRTSEAPFGVLSPPSPFPLFLVTLVISYSSSLHNYPYVFRELDSYVVSCQGTPP